MSARTIRFAAIGAGNMGQAILRGALAADVLKPAQTLVIDVDGERRAAFEQLGCRTSGDPAAVADADAILLAVKPQSYPSVAMTIGRLPRPALVISVMAGIRSETIRADLGETARIVRVMPNTPAQVGAGMSAIALGAGARPGDDELALRLFSSIGETLRLDESMMDAVTAVCGSGPAYAFLLAESMERGAVALGFSEAEARLLVSQTLLGAATLLRRSGESPAALREAVTSRGGTTAAALDVMNGAGFVETVTRAMRAAADRAAALSTPAGAEDQPR